MVTPTRRAELLDAAYRHVLQHGIGSLSLRPMAEAIGSSTGVLRFLFESKDGLITALLARAAEDEQRLLDELEPGVDLAETAAQLWLWLATPRHRPTLVLWAECYAASLADPDGPFGDFASGTVQNWLSVLAFAQPPRVRTGVRGIAERTAVLALLRGCLLDLLATGDLGRTSRAVRDGLGALTSAV